jgi:hypothetical protein
VDCGFYSHGQAARESKSFREMYGDDESAAAPRCQLDFESSSCTEVSVHSMRGWGGVSVVSVYCSIEFDMSGVSKADAQPLVVFR